MTNAFGGKNPHGLYVPMTDVEQEVLSRLVEQDDFEVVVHGWGVVNRPRVSFGDVRVCVAFRLDFTAPDVPQPLYYLDLELKTRAGISLFKQRMTTLYGGQPVQVAAGMYLDLAWDIQIHHMDPKLVKALKSGAIGLTTRRLDKDTGEATFSGNMKLDGNQRFLLKVLGEGQKRNRTSDVARVVDATRQAGGEIKRTSRGLEVSHE